MNANTNVNQDEAEIALTKEIQRALEIMRRSRTAKAAANVDASKEAEGNQYILPEPLVLHASVD